MGAGFRLAYPVTPETVAALARFPHIAAALDIPATGWSDLEVVRLFGNVHYAHLDQVLAFIDRELPGSGEIGARLLGQTDPFHMNESLAELFLLSHLRARLGADARPAAFPRNAVGPEIEVRQPDFSVKIEVYSPLDLAGYQLVTEHAWLLFKYINVNRGFSLEVAIEPVDDSVGSVCEHFPARYPTFDEEFQATTGLTIEEYFVCATAVSTHYLGASGSNPIFHWRSAARETEYQAVFQKYVTLESQTPIDLASSLTDERAGYRGLRDQPILRTEDGRAIVLDPVLYSDRSSVGPLFHLLGNRNPSVNANRVFSAYGMAFEDYVAAILMRIYPPAGSLLASRLRVNVVGVDTTSRPFEIDAVLNDVKELVLFE